jgi:hypothetical protein
VVIGDSHDRTKYPLRDEGTASGIGHVKNLLLNLRRELQHAHDLCHSSACDSLLTGDVGLIGDLAEYKESLPFVGLAEELDHPGCLGFPTRIRLLLLTGMKFDPLSGLIGVHT